MHPNTRACIAYIAARYVAQNRKSSIYDYSQSRHINVDGAVTDKNINLFDYDRGCHFGGSLSNLYDYGRSAHVSLEFKGKNFSGYDYGDGHHFSGSVNSGSVSVYDYGQGQYFNYR